MELKRCWETNIINNYSVIIKGNLRRNGNGCEKVERSK
jgi:hypothetical protein